MKIVAIDPGFRDCGVAVFGHDVLVHCDHVKSDATGLVEAVQFSETARSVVDFVASCGVGNIFDLVIEYPQQYARSPAPRESVQRLVGVIGSLVSQFHQKTGGLGVKVTTYKPREWKGQVPKEVMQNRILKRLSDQEFDRIPKMSRTRVSHVYDAIGIGLHHMGRLSGVAPYREAMPSSLG